MKIIVAGGSGFIGSELIRKLLEAKHHVILLSRNPDSVGFKQSDFLQIAQWDGKNAGDWSGFVDGADAVINLSGENIASKRWSKYRKSLLLDSRIKPTRALVEAISRVATKPRVLINTSAVGFYGNFGEGDVTESETQGSGFLAELCSKWEHEAVAAEKYGVRVVLLRIGVVLEQSGGALKKMMMPFKLFTGGPLGSGRQWFPWIHREDVISIILFALESNLLNGAVNVASPSPVTMSGFASSLGEAMRRPSWMAVPSLFLKIILGEMSEMLIGGRRIIPKKLIDNGFIFRYPDLNTALNSIIHTRKI